MASESLNTKEKILECAKDEFLKKGFKDSSLRNIARNAGVTTGAVYGYFKDKDAIFCELVNDFMVGLKELINEIEGNDIESDIVDLLLNKENRSNMVEVHNRYINYVYDNIDKAKLIILCADGSSVENYVEEISTYFTEIQKKGLCSILAEKSNIDEFLFHIIVKFYISSLCELIEHDIKREDAIKYISSLSTFFFAGWAELLR